MSFATGFLPIQAQTRSNNNDPSGNGRPPNRVDGGDRGGRCSATKTSANKNLIALVPATGEALSTAESPTILFYVPYASDSSLAARLSLHDENGYRVIKPIQMTLSEIPGIVSLRLPIQLERNKSYHWFFTIICDTTNGTNNAVVDGWIRRIEPSPTLARQFKEKKSQQERAELYVKEGLWLDALAQLTHIPNTNRQADTDWTNLLQNLDLRAIAPEKIVPCCTFK
ncbi:MAG: DUF928 domain-containing protein [Scytonema sp. RU_4_4]|nr:DUF928 domain-containing protein [Scytonema sp. RU_4_4]NJR74555.1 DUF928 domain-containing protein [Scytonema sp. CRU_2_7]